MKKSLKVLLTVLLVILVITIPFVGSYNSMVTSQQKVNTAESNIDAQLQRRSDLIPNVVETVKGYAAQESEIFTQVAESRSKLAGATTTEEKAAADQELTGAVGRLLAISERYPDLKSDQVFRDLTVQLEGTENRISVSRQNFNDAASEYNTSIKRFPRNIVAGMFGFKEKPYFKADEAAKEAPKVEFNNKK
ncbi:LemA family protein [Clostridium algidicarnis]|uniref:LemA family protein n=1 Tax=Clostridium algidicarnis TaxID=37659 RepID=UPI0004969D1D|nr:LemA family protein [Clostridium algidicarnis]MBB6696735.1 LemA family protein [Clostridium algidicarnis]MBU3192679.1 LemA family protein [Clostridium algidicarnis]MBU3204003.1 LemA family protein [Clostridium algidicarnis]MBU3207384.1 LemA family protein [Clostridium algidicarnis]MBU3212157.1 LemA family protein [Clostridium algidicarnis]